MRSTGDRIRHAILFEFFGLLLVTPLGTVIFGLPMSDVGVIALGGATLAMMWNYIYNLSFDIILNKLTGSTLKAVWVRGLHAVLFEAGLLILLLPFIAYYLGISMWAAFVMDIYYALFFVIFAFCFNWAYDRIFPLPEWSNAKLQDSTS